LGEVVLIGNAWAQSVSAPSGQGFDLMGYVPLIFVTVMAIYFLFAQMRRSKEQKTMGESLQKGDEIIAAGGVLGRVSKLDENYITLQIASNVEVRVQRSSLQVVLPKGTIKNLE
jgi:preprotein translocase subunit YajC